MQKIPYMLVVGDNEVKEGSVNVRKYGEQKSETISFEDFVKAIKEEVNDNKGLRKTRLIDLMVIVVFFI